MDRAMHGQSDAWTDTLGLIEMGDEHLKKDIRCCQKSEIKKIGSMSHLTGILNIA